MAEFPDFYSVLGVQPTADHAAIHSAWKALLRRYHPDANPGVDASARAKEINEAYAVLGKKDARAAYDRLHRPPSRPAAAHRPVYATPAGRRPTRPGPSRPPSSSVSQPLDGAQWLTGLLLLMLTAAPIGLIVALHHEETQRHAARRAADLRRDAAAPAFGRAVTGTQGTLAPSAP